MNNRNYINDFCEDLNYQGVILYIGNVNPEKLLKELKRSDVNKLYRFESILNDDDLSRRNFMYVENCDLQNLDYPIYEYMEDGYDIYVLYEDAGKYYVKSKLRWYIPGKRGLSNQHPLFIFCENEHYEVIRDYYNPFYGDKTL